MARVRKQTIELSENPLRVSEMSHVIVTMCESQGNNRKPISEGYLTMRKSRMIAMIARQEVCRSHLGCAVVVQWSVTVVT